MTTPPTYPVRRYQPTADTVEVIDLMTVTEAQHHTTQAREHLNQAWRHITLIHERQGWRALGYRTLTDWAATELQIGKPQLYRHLKAARVADHLEGLPNVDQLTERHARVLAQLPPDTARTVWQEAHQTGLPVTAPRLEQIAAGHQPEPEPVDPLGRGDEWAHTALVAVRRALAAGKRTEAGDADLVEAHRLLGLHTQWTNTEGASDG